MSVFQGSLLRSLQRWFVQDEPGKEQMWNALVKACLSPFLFPEDKGCDFLCPQLQSPGTSADAVAHLAFIFARPSRGCQPRISGCANTAAHAYSRGGVWFALVKACTAQKWRRVQLPRSCLGSPAMSVRRLCSAYAASSGGKRRIPSLHLQKDAFLLKGWGSLSALCSWISHLQVDWSGPAPVRRFEHQ